MQTRFSGLADIKPMIGPLGDDLYLRAIHAGFMGHQVQQDEPYVREAWMNGLIRFNEDDIRGKNSSSRPGSILAGFTRVITTDQGALYWQTRGGDFSKFIYQCPDLNEMTYSG